MFCIAGLLEAPQPVQVRRYRGPWPRLPQPCPELYTVYKPLRYERVLFPSVLRLFIGRGEVLLPWPSLTRTIRVAGSRVHPPPHQPSPSFMILGPCARPVIYTYALFERDALSLSFLFVCALSPPPRADTQRRSRVRGRRCSLSSWDSDLTKYLISPWKGTLGRRCALNELLQQVAIKLFVRNLYVHNVAGR